MKPLYKKFKRYLPLGLGVIILILAAIFVPWSDVIPYILKLSPTSYLLLFLFSLLYYFGRTLRYWLMLRMLGQNTSMRIVALSCLVAQPISVLPGGELYRAIMLKRYGNVALKDSAASAFAQSLAESLGLVVIALAGAATIHKYVLPTALIAIALLGIWIAINLYNGTKAHRLTNLVPGVNIHPSRVAAYLRRNRILLSGKNFIILLAASLVSTIAGIAIVATITHGLGLHINLAQAAMIFALPAVLEVVSFLPGGLGANEGTSIALLALFGQSIAIGIAITILVRLFTLGIGFFYGFIAMMYARLGKFPKYS